MTYTKKFIDDIVLKIARAESGLEKEALKNINLNSSFGKNGLDWDEIDLICFTYSLEDEIGLYFEIPEDKMYKIYGENRNGNLRGFSTYVFRRLKGLKKSKSKILKKKRGLKERYIPKLEREFEEY